jgi:hypothetical protein
VSTLFADDVMRLALGDIGVGPGGASFTFAENARLLGAYAWIEQRLFELLGGWIATEPVPEVRIVFDVHGRQHGWHAQLFADLVPSVDGSDPADLIKAPGQGVVALFAEAAVPSGGWDAHLSGERTHGEQGRSAPGAVPSSSQIIPPARGGTLLRLVALGRVLTARLVTTYSRHLHHSAPIADAPVIRALRLVLADEIEAWRGVEALVQALAHRHHDLAVCAERQQMLEALIEPGGVGLVRWPAT